LSRKKKSILNITISIKLYQCGLFSNTFIVLFNIIDNYVLCVCMCARAACVCACALRARARARACVCVYIWCSLYK